MKSLVFFTASSLLLLVLPAAGQAMPAMTAQGCFSSSDPMEDQGSYTYQSSGYCQQVCFGLGKAVMGTTMGSNCWCGDQLPSADSKVSDGKCDTPCNGYNKANCGGANTWSVALTGVKNNVANVGSSGSSTTSSSPTSASPSPTKSQAPSVVTMGGATIIVTASDQATAPATIVATATATPKPSSSKPNTAGIAAGVVVGVIAIAAIIGGGWLFLRARRRRAVEEEYRRNAAISNFTGGGKTASTPSLSDSRLEPSVMMQRRMSDGSIADNQDYSRRILKVTNPDGT